MTWLSDESYEVPAMARHRANGLILRIGLFCLALGMGLLVGYALLSGQPSANGGELDFASSGGIILIVLGAAATIMELMEDH